MQPQTIIILETEGTTHSNLYPFNILHPSFEVRCGALRLFEKVQARFPASNLVFHAEAPERALHLASFRARFGFGETTSPENTANILVLDGNVIMDEMLTKTLKASWKQTSQHLSTNAILRFTNNGTPFAAYIPEDALPKDTLPEGSITQGQMQDIANFDSTIYQNAIHVAIPEIKQIRYLWDALAYNAAAIEEDAQLLQTSTQAASTPFSQVLSAPGVFALNTENILVSEGVQIAPCVVLDARKGAIILGRNVEIQPHVSIVGPCFVGDDVLIKAGTRIYEGTSLGAASKVSGEIKNTIFQGFGNKQHDGCLGYSFIGEWVNLGAGTDVSDLKNNYSTIRVRFSPDKAQEISTGKTSLGLLAGDHTKSAINTSFNTGTVTGVSANVFDGAPDKYVASFSWGGQPDSPLFDEEKAIELARTVMSRRKRELLPEEEALLRREYHHRPAK